MASSPQRRASRALAARLSAVENAARSLGGATPSLNQTSRAAQGRAPAAKARAPRGSRVRQRNATARQTAYRGPSFLVQIPRPAANPASASSRRERADAISAAAIARKAARGTSDCWLEAKVAKQGGSRPRAHRAAP